MHVAHSTSDSPALPFNSVAPLLEVDVVAVRDREVVAVAVLAGLDVVEVVALVTDAMLGLFEFPPHPATRTPLASPAAASSRARGGRNSRFASIWSCNLVLFRAACVVRTGSTRRSVS
jgi:hypothetical protein